MRRAFIKTLVAEARRHPNLWLLYGDLGFGVLEPFIEEFPDRSVNCGVAEQNAVGVAAGLAACGKVVFWYSICNFAVLRPLEQLRNDVCYPNANVKVVGVGVGKDYGTLGYTHWGLEDERIVKQLPNIRVVTPGKREEVPSVIALAAQAKGPVYIRLRRA